MGLGRPVTVGGADRDGPVRTKTVNPNPRLFSFVGGREGPWTATASSTIVGDPWPEVERLQVIAGNPASSTAGAAWVLRGVISHERYVTRSEKEQLVARQPQLGRPGADRAVLIPIRKNARWWALTPDERRQIFEERSHHTAIGMDYLPAIARRLHHCRDLGESEPFDFLTWFEFGASDSGAFDRLLTQLRATEEWKYVDREVEVRLIRSPQASPAP